MRYLLIFKNVPACWLEKLARNYEVFVTVFGLLITALHLHLANEYDSFEYINNTISTLEFTTWQFNIIG